MSKEVAERRSHIFRLAVIAFGACLWLAAVGLLTLDRGWREQLMLVALVPVTIIVGMFTTTFRLPSGLKFTEERITFTLSDALVLLIAYDFGIAAAIFVAGVESFASARRKARTKNFTTVLFNAAMMAVAATAAGGALSLTTYFTHASVFEHPFVLTAIALLAASVVQTIVNLGVLSALLAMRHNGSFFHYLKGFYSVAPTLLVTGTTASLMQIAISYNVLALVVLGAPVFAALFVAHRQQRDGVQKRISMMEKAHRETIEALAVTINAKDEVTHEHVQRVQIYATGVARLLGCSESEIEALKAGALLHDIGKIAVPDYILNKPGKLTAEEFERMKLHTVVGAQILGRVEFPYPVVPIVRSHHERWDGKGYPDALSGEDIPLTARILSVVDCFDAVREDRQYRKGMTREEAVELLMQGSGTQYDPRVVGTFVTHLPQFEAEVLAHRDVPTPTFGIEPAEQLSEAARAVTPAAGLAEPTGEAPVDDLPQFKHKELQALYRLAQKLNGARGRVEVARVCTEELGALLPFETCAVTLADARSGEFQTVRAAGAHAARLETRYIGVGEGVTGWVLANRRSFLNTSPTLDIPSEAAADFKDYRTLAIFPLIRGEELYGAISLYSASLTEYTPEHERIMNEAGTLIAAALATAAAIEAVTPDASPSTGDAQEEIISHDAAHRTHVDLTTLESWTTH